MKNLKANHSDGVVVVRPASETMSRQRLPYYVGISESTAGAKNISMNLIVIPPAGAAEPHLHKGYETAIYLLKGRVDTRYGHELEKSIICQEGDFILIKPDVPHQPINLNATEPALLLSPQSSRAMTPTSKRALCTIADKAQNKRPHC